MRLLALRRRSIIVPLLVMLSYCASPGQRNDTPDKHTFDSTWRDLTMEVGVPMPESQFDSLVCVMIERIESVVSLSRDECATIIRIDNTLDYDDLCKRKAIYSRFCEAISGKLKMVLEKLNGVEGRGGGTYFKEYDLYFGGPLTPNSKYKITY